MQNFNFLEKELLDIIFKGRNQQYGAYVLRKTYPQRVRNAMAVTGAIILSVVGVFLFSASKLPPLVIPEFPTEEPHVLKRIEMDKPAPTKTGQLRKKVVRDHPPTEITNDYLPVVTPPTIKPQIHDDIITSPTGTDMPITSSGGGGTAESGSLVPTSSTEGAVVHTKTTEFKPMVDAQVMPQFPGGEEAMLLYLQEHIIYPRMAVNRGVQGVVYVEFVVNRTGKISHVQLLNNVGAGCDEEAVRVIKSMPAWSPGMQDGNKVDVSYRIPVQFEL